MRELLRRALGIQPCSCRNDDTAVRADHQALVQDQVLVELDGRAIHRALLQEKQRIGRLEF